jgi:hypothetical protein
MGVSTALADDVLAHVLQGSYQTWVSLHTALPVPGVTEHELDSSAVNYGRVQVLSSGWTTPASASSSNVAQVTFSTAGSNWAAVTHVGIYDAATAGNLLWFGALAVARTVHTGESLAFAIGNLAGSVQ